jgi:23S rRNA pseudouridine1911/1915/1917 synthase
MKLPKREKPTSNRSKQFVERKPDPNNKLVEMHVKGPHQLLEFLLTNVKQSRNNIKSLLKNKKVIVDGAVVTQFDYMLRPKQVVSISKYPMIQKSLQSSLDIVYEDDDLIVINKPAGLLTVGTDKEIGETAYRMVMDYVRTDHRKGELYIVHRLDRDTSGLLIFSKNYQLREALQDDWNKLVKYRGYYALVQGNLKNKKDTLKHYLKENTLHMVYVSTNSHEAQEAITHYSVIKESKQHSLLEMKIDTGRKNQIRVQMDYIGHPVLGDKKYGKPDDPLKRLGLHAYRLEFTHPLTQKYFKFETRLPPIFMKLFK